MMRQFHAAKDKHPQALLFFRMGDFYELFFEDAKVAAKELGLTLTARDKEREVPMAGVPVRAMEGYLTRLVRAGHTVAICEQLQDPREAKGIVERDVVRVVSPGTLVDDASLDGAEPLFVLAVSAGAPRGKDKARPAGELAVGLAWADISTGAFRCMSTTAERFAEELARVQPAEVLFPDYADGSEDDLALAPLRAAVAREEVPRSLREPWTFDAARGRRDLREQLGVATLEAFGVDELPEAVAACGALLGFLKDTQKGALDQLRELRVHDPVRHLVLDRATRRTLELVHNQHDGGRDGTLLATVDRTATPMGARLLREWLLEPLVDAAAIGARHDAVGTLREQTAARRELAQQLDGLGDLERLAAKLASGRALPRDLAGLAHALTRVPALKEVLAALPAVREATADGTARGELARLHAALDPCAAVAARIHATLADELPLGVKDGGLVRSGFSAELDELHGLASGGREYLAELQARELERTGISTLKIGFNRVFGYYIEVSKSFVNRVPEEYTRKQTLKNAERYITPELKEYEAKVLGAEEKSQELEYRIFEELRAAAAAEAPRMLATARALAELDVLQGLATLAAERGYVRPEFVEPAASAAGVAAGPAAGPAAAPADCGVLEVRDGRHPVVEAALAGEPFVPNDTVLDGDSRLAVLTGPNMAGKSTYLRQNALIVLLAHIGSFVPAKSARMTLVDRIFTRLGGGDDISRGQSTFMVEMVETANILRHATARSLLLLEEVGRGTSTFDGLAIAWAVCEHVHDRIGARCLFATHYHQLTDLADSLPAARNLNVAVREWQEEVVFLHRIEEGGTDRSYGIHVGQLAGLPREVLARSRAVLERLERDEEGLSRRILASHDAPVETAHAEPVVFQPGLFDLLQQADPELLEDLRDVDLDTLPPIEAWQLLARIKRRIDAR